MSGKRMWIQVLSFFASDPIIVKHENHSENGLINWMPQ